MVYTYRHLTLTQVIGLVLLGIIITYSVFMSLDLRGLGFILLMLIVAEVFTQTKWRASMICRNCGFDPVVYIRSPEQAGLKIKAFMDKRSQSPDHLLRPQVRWARQPLESEKKAENLSLKV